MFGALWLERGLSACVQRSGLSFTYYVARDYPFVKNKIRTRLDLTRRRGGWPGQAPDRDGAGGASDARIKSGHDE
jgi:hypothetical protein